MFLLQTTKQVDKKLSTNSVLQKRFDEWIKKLVVSPHTEHEGQMKNKKYEGLPVFKK